MDTLTISQVLNRLATLSDDETIILTDGTLVSSSSVKDAKSFFYQFVGTNTSSLFVGLDRLPRTTDVSTIIYSLTDGRYKPKKSYPKIWIK